MLKEEHEALLNNRRELSIKEYEEILQQSLPKDETDIELDSEASSGTVILSGVRANIREYSKKK